MFLLLCFGSLFRSHVKDGGLEAEAWKRRLAEALGLEVLISCRQSTALGYAVRKQCDEVGDTCWAGIEGAGIRGASQRGAGQKTAS